MVEIKLKITKHANDKMMWLGISEEDVKKAILRGSKFKQTDGYLAIYTYLKVAYKKSNENVYKIKTVMIE